MTNDNRPADLVLFDYPGLRVTVSTRGGGTVALHYLLEINGKWAHDDSSSGAHSTRQMFPGNDQLLTWIAQVAAWDAQKYQEEDRARGFGGGFNVRSSVHPYV